VNATLLRFDRFTLDPARASLRRGHEEIELRPKSFDVLRYLVENAGRVVSKDEIFGAVWADVIVTDSSLVQCVREIRQALDDEAQRLVKTVARRGYLFDASVTRAEPGDLADAAQARSAADAREHWRPRRAIVVAVLVLLAGGALLAAGTLGWYRPSPASDVGPPSIAVMFFAAGPSDGNDWTHDYFSDGLTDDVIAAFGRFSGLRVLSRHALNSYRGSAWQPPRLWQDLKARYVVDGSVRKYGDRLRVSSRLTDAAQRVVLWSETYDEELKDIFAVQDRLTRSIVGRLAVRISRIEAERAAAKPTSSMEAYDYALRGREKLARITRADNLEARRLFQTAAELDPRYAAAFVGLGNSYQNDLVYGWAERPEESARRAYEYAHRAVVLDESDPACHLLLAHVYLLRREHGLALAETDRALQLNPNDADAHATRGIMLVWMGRIDDAIAAFETAAQFDPNQSRPRALAHLGLAYFLADRYDDAVRALELSVGRNPEFALGHIGLVAAYGALNKRAAAEHAAEMVRQLDPFFTSASFGGLFANEAYQRRLVESLRKIGL
jgi:TolB-like protein/DNA-binding winged helix-turn-helix (wHTH) protein/Flp pilus assembly protein TadD